MSVRPAVEDDAGALARLHERCWSVSYAGLADASWLTRRPIADRVQDWVGLTRGDVAELWVACADDKVAGFVAAGPSRDDDAPEGTGEIIALYVDPTLQGQGHGSALLERAVEELREEGLTRATLWTLEGNAKARKFYAKHGWKPAGGRKEHRSLGAHEVRYARDL